MSNRLRIKKSVFIFCCILLFFLVGLVTPVNANNYGFQSDTPIVIKGERNFPPYEFINELGEPDGFNVEIVDAIMRELDIPYILTLEPWPQVMDDLNEGKIDLLTGMMYTRERAKRFKFGAIHNHIFLNVVYRKGEKTITSLDALRNKQVIVLEKDITQELLEQEGFKNELITVKDLGEGLSMLSKGKCDYAIANYEMARAIMRMRRLRNLEMVDLDLPIKEYCFVGNNDSLLAAVDQVFYKIKQNGTYDAIYNRWFASVKKHNIPVYVYFVVGILLFITLVSSVFIRLLQQQVKKASRDLELESRKLTLALLADNLDVWGYDVRKDRLYNIQGEIFPKEGMTLAESVVLVHPEDREPFGKVFAKVIAGEIPDKPILYRFRNYNRDEWVYIEKRFAIIRLPNGEVESVIGTHKDLTAEVLRKKEKEQLLKKYRTVFNSTLVGLEYYDSNGILLDINDTICNIFGVEDKESLLKNRLSIYDNPRLKEFIDWDKPLEPFNEIIEYDFDELAKTDFYSFTSKKGRCNIEIRIIPIYTAEESLDCIIMTAIDVTESQNLQKRMRENVRKTELVIQATNTVLWEFDCLTKEFRCYNEPVNGYDENRLITLEDYKESFHPDDFNKATENVSHMLEGHDRYAAVDVRVKYPGSDDWHFCTIDGVPFEYDKKTGRVIKYAGFRRDNTEMILTQINLEKEKENAQKADRLKSAFLANMSHEIRTPLNAIVGFSSLLQDVEDSEERAQFVEIINTNSDLLLRLINDILDLSKIESGIVEFSREDFDMVSFFDGVTMSLRQRVTNPDVEFIIENPYKSCIVYLDRDRLTQVFINFVTNAIKYTLKGFVKVSYKYENEGIYVSVEDTGIGIPESKHHRIFHRFEKLDDFAQGTGLGLSICKAIVDAGGGKIGFTSKEGCGSTFWAWIPCKAQIEEREE